jgi:hypothetical protein
MLFLASASAQEQKEKRGQSNREFATGSKRRKYILLAGGHVQLEE